MAHIASSVAIGMRLEMSVLTSINYRTFGPRNYPKIISTMEQIIAQFTDKFTEWLVGLEYKYRTSIETQDSLAYLCPNFKWSMLDKASPLLLVLSQYVIYISL